MVAIPFKLLNGQTFMVEADPSFTILQVKQQVEANHGVPVAKQTMIFAGRKLRDDATIVDLGIVSETAVMLVLPPGTNIRMGPPPRADPAPGGKAAEEPPARMAAPPPVAAPAAVTASPVSPYGLPPAPTGGIGGSVSSAAKVSSASTKTPPASTAGAGAGGTAGAGGASGAVAAPAPSAAAVVALNVKELSGTIRTVHVRLNQPFKEIKMELQRLTGIPAQQQRLVFRGALVDDMRTPSFYNCNNDTCMHLVRHVTRDVLAEVITKEGLKANCMYCHKAGSQFDARPLCANCFSRDANPESVMMTAGDLTIGRTTWRDLLKIKVQCFNCQKQGPAAIGFLCMQPQDDGHNCVSRRERRLQNTYKGTGEEELQATMNRHYGYAHAGGMQDTVAV